MTQKTLGFLLNFLLNVFSQVKSVLGRINHLLNPILQINLIESGYMDLKSFSDYRVKEQLYFLLILKILFGKIIVNIGEENA